MLGFVYVCVERFSSIEIATRCNTEVQYGGAIRDAHARTDGSNTGHSLSMRFNILALFNNFHARIRTRIS